MAPSLGLGVGAGLAAWGRTAVGSAVVAASGLVLLAFLAFFRDPERPLAGGVVSAADGKVRRVETSKDGLVVSVFMAPWSVHVNRAPLAGRVVAVSHRAGGHSPAFTKESDRNERVDLQLSTSHGLVAVRLIAGTVARRIRPYVAVGDRLEKGDRIALIAFGSRCDVTLPRGFRPTVRGGQWVHAAADCVAEMEGSDGG